MLFQLSFVASLLAFVDKAVSVDTDFSLYAYGTGITPGLQLFYGDGQAYVGAKVPTFVSEAVNVTMSQIDTDDDSGGFQARPERTMDWTANPNLCIDTDAGTINPVTFVSGNETGTNGSTTNGFGLYGGWAFHKDTDGTIEMNFLASPTNESDIYLVKWNSGGTKASTDVSIALRTQAPIAITT